jgi:hypothetical protein
MVRRLVQQQQVRLQCQRERQSRTLALAAGGRLRRAFAVEIEAMKVFVETPIAVRGQGASRARREALADGGPGR